MKRQFFIGLIITTLLFITTSKSFYGQEWTEPINISNLGGYSKSPDMVIDHKGTIHIVWVYKKVTTYALIMYSFSEDDGITWSEPFDLLQNSDYLMEQPHIACDSKSNLYVTYTHDYLSWTPSGRLIKMLYCDGHQWSEPITVSEGMAGSHYNYIIVDHNDRIYVSWDHVPSGKNYFRYLENNTWSKMFCPYPNSAYYALTEAGVDKRNNLHWIGSFGHYNIKLQYFLYNYTSNTWYPPEQPVNDTINVGLDIALNIDDIPESAYRKKSTTSVGFTTDSTMHIQKEGGFWGTPELVAGTNGMQQYQQIAIDQNDNVHEVEQNETARGYGLVHYKKKGNSWIGQFIDSCYIVNFPKLLFSNNQLYCVYSKTWVIEKEFYGDLYLTKYDIVTNIDKKVNQPETLNIFPNPTSCYAYIDFDNAKQQQVNLSVFDISGKHIKTLCNKTLPPGKQRLLWHGTNQSGKEVQSGSYIVRLKTGSKTVTQIVEVVR